MLPHGLPEREDTLRLGKGLLARKPRAVLQQHQEQRLRLRHHVARPIRQDTAVSRIAATDFTSGVRHGGGESRSAAQSGQGGFQSDAAGVGEAENQPFRQA